MHFDSGVSCCLQTVVDVVVEAFPQRARSEIEVHMDDLFRTPFFNLAERR